MVEVLEKYANDNSIGSFLHRIFRRERGYKEKLEKEPLYVLKELPFFVTSNKEMANFIGDELKLPCVYAEGDSYEDVVGAIRKGTKEFENDRVVLVGVRPLKNLKMGGRGIKTFAPYFDLDEDGYLEVSGSYMPPDKELIREHVNKIRGTEFRKPGGKEKIVVVVQEGEKRFAEKVKEKGFNYQILHKVEGEGYEQWKDADAIFQVSDGEPRIHSDGVNWDLAEKFIIFCSPVYQVLNGKNFLEKTERGYRFERYPFVFSEACHCGETEKELPKAFFKAGCLYTASTATTSNITRKTRWENAFCGDGVKYGFLEKLDEYDTMFQIYRVVMNTLLDHLPRDLKLEAREVLSGEHELYEDVFEILTITMFGLDRPSPVRKRKHPRKIGEIDDL